MKKEQYIDQIKSIHSLYNKLEELVNISRLPITIESFNLKYNLMDMKRVGNTYYYRKDSKSVFVFLEGRIARLAYFDEDSAEIYEVDLEHANTFKQYTYRDGKVTEISINSKCLSITSSNNITNDFKALLNSLSVKFNINYNKL